MVLPVFFLFAVFCLLPGCASGPYAASSGTSSTYLTMILTVKGEIDTGGGGYYIFHFNSTVDDFNPWGYPIDTADTGALTSTDFLKYSGDGLTYEWWHKRLLPPSSYQWEKVTSVNGYCTISPDRKKLIFQVDVNDNSIFFSQWIASRRFSVNVVTTDNGAALIGTAIDTLGGPGIDGNSAYTCYVDKYTGIKKPVSGWYPLDYEGADDLNHPPGFPPVKYPDYDIASFEILIQ
jgi:hypothetical protein